MSMYYNGVKSHCPLIGVYRIRSKLGSRLTIGSLSLDSPVSHCKVIIDKREAKNGHRKKKKGRR